MGAVSNRITSTRGQYSLEEIVFLFGVAGVGKNWVAERLRDRMGYYFYDADIDLTPVMRAAITAKEHFTDSMRDEFFALIARRIAELRKIHPKLVVAQAAYKQRNRDYLSRAVPGLKFIWVRAPNELIIERLGRRGDWISPEYAAQIYRNFEPPKLPCLVIENDGGEARVLDQLQRLLEGEPR